MNRLEIWNCLLFFCLFVDSAAPLSPAAVIITSSIRVDPATLLSTSTSILQYTASKDDIGAVFACVSTHELDGQEKKLDPFPVHCKWNTAPSAGYLAVLHYSATAQVSKSFGVPELDAKSRD